MLIVKKGWVTHNSVTYGRGQALPRMKKAEELRLLDLGTCFEGDIPKLDKEESSPPVDPSVEKEANGAEGEGNPPNNAGLNLNFDPSENIKAKA